jgi:ethanolamine utilization protein EutN
MQIARVIGTVVSTVKNQTLEGRKFLIVQTLDADLNEKGKPQVALDAVGAGVGELVFWCRGKEASFPFKRDETPTDCTIVGIIDSEAHVFQSRESGESSEAETPKTHQTLDTR